MGGVGLWFVLEPLLAGAFVGLEGVFLCIREVSLLQSFFFLFLLKNVLGGVS